jgi:hypothetical protein
MLSFTCTEGMELNKITPHFITFFLLDRIQYLCRYEKDGMAIS